MPHILRPTARIIRTNLYTVRWYAGVNINCTVPRVDEAPNFPPFLVRVWESCEGSTACVYANDDTGKAHPGVQCRDENHSYTDGSIVSSGPCYAGLGRGSVRVVSGCCKMWRTPTCGGDPYMHLGQGGCDQEVQFEGFECVSPKKSLILCSIDTN